MKSPEEVAEETYSYITLDKFKLMVRHYGAIRATHYIWFMSGAEKYFPKFVKKHNYFDGMPLDKIFYKSFKKIGKLKKCWKVM